MSTDWTTAEGCERCAKHGPFLPGVSSGEVARDLHQAWHAIVAALMQAAHIPQIVGWLARRRGA